MLDVRTNVPVPALVNAPTPLMTPELVTVLVPVEMVPLPERAMLLAKFRFVSASRVVLLLAKVTVPVPRA